MGVVLRVRPLGRRRAWATRWSRRRTSWDDPHSENLALLQMVSSLACCLCSVFKVWKRCFPEATMPCIACVCTGKFLCMHQSPPDQWSHRPLRATYCSRPFIAAYLAVCFSFCVFIGRRLPGSSKPSFRIHAGLPRSTQPWCCAQFNTLVASRANEHALRLQHIGHIRDYAAFRTRGGLLSS